MDKIDEFIHVLNLRGRAETTLENYDRFLKYFIRDINKNINEIEVRDIRLFLMKEQNEKGNKKSTISTKISIIKSFFSWLITEGFINSNPSDKIEKPKVVNNQIKFLTHEEIELIRESAGKLIDRTIIETLYSSGIRVSEAVNLDWNDIDFDKKKLYVRNGKGGKNRTTLLSTKAVMLLKKYRSSREDENNWVFQSNFRKRMSKESIERHMRLVGERANLSKRLTPHRLRHSLATHLLNGGMAIDMVQKILGHSKLSTTQIYAKTDTSNIDYHYRKINP